MIASLKSKAAFAADSNGGTVKAATLLLTSQGLRALLTEHRRHQKPIHRHAHTAKVAAVVQDEDDLHQRTGDACRPGCLEEARAAPAWLVRLNAPLSTWATR